jgi:hypothetical protein
MSISTQSRGSTGAPARKRRGSVAVGFVALFTAAVLLAACSTSTGGGTGGLAAAGASPSAASTPVPSQTATQAVNPTSTPGTPTPTGTAAPAVALTAHVGTPTVPAASVRSSHCPVTVGYAATITVNKGPATVAYVWHDSTGAATTGHVTFPQGGTQHAIVHHPVAITTTLLDTATHGWANIALTSPQSGATANTNVVLRCEPAVASFTVTAPAFGHCGGAYTVTSAVVTVPFGPATVHYTMNWGDGKPVETGTQKFLAGGAQHVNIGLHHQYADGDWTMKFSLAEGGSSGGKRMLCSGSV